MVAVAKRKRQDTGFGRRLRALREAANLTLMDLGERTGMLYQNIARLERGEREPNWPTVLKIAEALGADLNDFRAGGDTPAETEAVAPPEPAPPRAMGKRK